MLSDGNSTWSFLHVALIGTGAWGLWDIYLSWRQLYAHRPSVRLPQKLQGVVEEESFEKTQAYTRDKLRYSISKQAVDLVLNVGSLWSGLLPAMWYWSATATSTAVGSAGHYLAFGVASEVVSTLTTIPFSYYYNFVIEERYGFNKMSGVEFAKDVVKSFVLKTCVLSPLVASLVNTCVNRFGVSFPKYLFGAGAVLSVAATYIIPVVIMPLFNKFTPIADGELKTGVEALALKLRFPLSKMYEVDGSRRSAHSNAYFYGFYNNKRIVLYDTLLTTLEKDQILAVVCHEFGHWYHNHTIAMLGIGMAQLAAMCSSARFAIFHPRLYTDFGFLPSENSPYIGFTLFIIAFFEPLSNFLSMLVCALSRRFEFQADRFAVEMGFGEQLREGLVKMQKENSMTITPDTVYAMFNYSHPPLIERLNAIDVELKRQQ